MEAKQEELRYTKLKRPKTKGSAKLFKNPILEKLTHTHISAPLIIFGVVAGGLFYYGIAVENYEPSLMIFLFIGGFVFFTLVEYLLHRFLYHMSVTNELRRKITYTMHGNHHDYPKDKSRLAMPPILGLALSAILLGLFWLIMQNYAFGFLAGFLIGYASYIGIHYSIHAFKVPDNFLKVLWYHHSIHHYREDDRAFGVSSPFWDYIFGTMPRKNPKQHRQKKSKR